MEEAALRGLGEFEDALLSVVDGSKSAKEAFSDMARSILADISRLLIRQNITGPMAGALGGLFGGGGIGSAFGAADPWAGLRMAKGGVFAGGNVTAFANGGIVNRPTLFPFSKGTGLMGEAGPEAIMPLTRTATGKLGVAAEGIRGGGGGEVKIEIINNAPVTVRNGGRSNVGGVDVQRIIIEAVTGDIAKGGNISSAMERQFGLDRTRGMG